VSALKKHDGEAAASAMRDHIEQIAELLQQTSEAAAPAGQRPA
jgi:DNA-binding GntR family transcriptional regulator